MGSPIKPVQSMSDDDYIASFIAEQKRKRAEEEAASLKMQEELLAFKKVEANKGAMGEPQPYPARGVTSVLQNWTGINPNPLADKQFDPKHSLLGQHARAIGGALKDKVEEFAADPIGISKDFLFGESGNPSAQIASGIKSLSESGMEIDPIAMIWTDFIRPIVANPIELAGDWGLKTIEGIAPPQFVANTRKRFGDTGLDLELTPEERQDKAAETIGILGSAILGFRAGQSVSNGARAERLLAIPEGAGIKEILTEHIPNAMKNLSPVERANLYRQFTAKTDDAVRVAMTEGIVGGVAYGLTERDASPSDIYTYMGVGAVLGTAFELTSFGWNKLKAKRGGLDSYDPKANMYRESVKPDVSAAILALPVENAAGFAGHISRGTELLTAYQHVIPENESFTFSAVPDETVNTSKLGSRTLVHPNGNGTSKVILFGEGQWEAGQATKRLSKSKAMFLLEGEDGPVESIVAAQNPLHLDAPLDEGFLARFMSNVESVLDPREAAGLTERVKSAFIQADGSLTPGITVNDLVRLADPESSKEIIKRMRYDVSFDQAVGKESLVIHDPAAIIPASRVGGVVLESISEGGKPRTTTLGAPRKGTVDDVKMLYPDDDAITLDHDPSLDITDDVLTWDLPGGKKVAIDGQLTHDGKFYVHMIRHSDGPGSLGPTLLHDIKSWVGEITGATEIGGLHVAGADAKLAGGGKESYIPTDIEGTTFTVNPKKQPVSIAQKAEFEATGFFTGQEVSYNGKSFVYNGRSKNGIRLIDPTDNAKLTVKLSEISDVQQPKVFEYDKATKTWQVSSMSDQLKTGSLQEALDLVGDNLSPRDKLLMDRNRTDEIRKQLDVTDVLSRRNEYIDTTGEGIVVRSLHDPAQAIQVKNYEGLQEYAANISKQQTKPDLLKEIHGDKFDLADRSNAGSINLGERGESRWGKNVIDWFRVQPVFNALAPMARMFETMERKYKISLGIQKIGLDDAVKAMNAELRVIGAKATMVMKPIADLGAEARARWLTGFETQSAQELMQRGISGQPMTQEAIALARELIEITSSNDRGVATRYRNVVAQLGEGLETGQITMKQYKAEMKSMQEQGNFGIGMTEAQLEVVGRLEEIVGRYVPDPLEPNKLIWEEGKMGPQYLEVMALADALELHTPSRAEFAADAGNGITPDLQMAWARVDALMREMAETNNIKYEARMWQYAPHIRKFLGSDARSMRVLRANGITDPKMATFIHDLTRTGFYGPQAIINDPVISFSKYIHASMRNKHIEPALLKLKKAAEKYKETRFDPVTGNRVTVHADGKALEFMDVLVGHVERMARGGADPTDRIAQASVASWAQRAIALDKNEATSWTTNWLRWNEFKAQGFKPSAGLRDGTTVMQSYLFLFGPERTKNLIKHMNEAAKRSKSLSHAGITAGEIEPTRMFGPAADTPYPVPSGVKESTLQGLAKAKEVIGEKLKTVTDEGFKWSFQPQVYRFFHAAAYLETTTTFAKNIGELSRKEISPEQFRQNTGMDLYPVATEKKFMEMLNAGDFEGATDFIADQTGQMAVGQYGLLNNPLAYGNKVGRLLLQYGQWPLWMLNNMAEGLTSGTLATRAKRAAFIGLSSYAAVAATEDVGIDLDRWSLNPLSMIPVGNSPAWQIATDLPKALDYGSPMQPFYMSKMVNQTAYLAKPWPIEFDAMMQAFVMAQKGAPFHIVGARLIGTPLDTKQYKSKDYNFWDF